MRIYPITEHGYGRLVAVIQTDAGKADFAKAARGTASEIIICRRLKNAGFKAQPMPFSAWNLTDGDWA